MIILFRIFSLQVSIKIFQTAIAAQVLIITQTTREAHLTIHFMEWVDMEWAEATIHLMDMEVIQLMVDSIQV